MAGGNMESAAPAVFPIQAGGVVRDVRRYVLRPADSLLVQELRLGRSCLVLGPPLIGKSSACRRARDELRGEGRWCADVDLAVLSRPEPPESWLKSMAYELARSLDAPRSRHHRDALDQHWSSDTSAPFERWIAFVRARAAVNLKGLVLFFDNVEDLTDVDLRKGLFAALAALASGKDGAPVVPSCIAGVSTPEELCAPAAGASGSAEEYIQSSTRITLEDFSDSALRAHLGERLGPFFGDPSPGVVDEIVLHVHSVAHGHPYITAYLLEELLGKRRDAALWAPGSLDAPRAILEWCRAVTRAIMEPSRLAQLDPIQRAEHLLAKDIEHQNASALLSLYRDVFLNEPVVKKRSNALQRLELAGLVTVEGDPGVALVRNNLVRRHFSLGWIAQHETAALEGGGEPDGKEEPKPRSLSRLFRSFVPGAVLVASTAWLITAEYSRSQREERDARRDIVDMAARLDAHPVAVDGARALVKALAAYQKDPSARELLGAISELTSASAREAWTGTHAKAVQMCLFSQDGALAATASEDGTAALWNVATGTRVGVLQHRGSVTEVAFSPQGDRLVTVSEDGTARLWSTKDGSLVRTFEPNDKALFTVAFWPAENALVVAGDSGVAHVLDIESGKERRTLQGHTQGIFFARMIPRSNLLVTAADDGDVRVWDTNGQSIRRLSHGAEIKDLSVSEDGKHVATAGADARAVVWSIEDGTSMELRGHRRAINSIELSADGRHIATGSRDGDVRIWEAETGSSTQILRHFSALNQLAFSPDGETLATSCTDGVLRVWEVRTGRPVTSLAGHSGAVVDVRYSPDGRSLLSAASDGAAKRFVLPENARIAALRGHTKAVLQVAFSPDGNRLISASEDGTARVWRADSQNDWHQVEELQHPAIVRRALLLPAVSRAVTICDDHFARIFQIGSPAKPIKLAHGGKVLDMALSSSGKSIATASADGAVRVWSALGELSMELKGGGAPVWALAVLGDDWVAAGGESGQLSLWSLHDGRERRLPAEGAHTFRWLSFSSDGRWLASANEDARVRVWRVPSGELETDRIAHNYSVHSVKFMPRSSIVATSGWDRAVRLWSVPEGKAVAELFRHDGPIHEVQFAWNDGASLATAGADGRVMVWDASHWSLLQELRGSSIQDVWNVAYSMDNRYLAVAAEDGVIRVYDVTDEGILRRACKFVEGTPESGSVAELCKKYW